MIEIKTTNPVYEKNLKSLLKNAFPDSLCEAILIHLPTAQLHSFFQTPPDVPTLVLGNTHPDSTAELPLPVRADQLIQTLRQLIEKNKNTPAFETTAFSFTGATRQLIDKKNQTTIRLTEKEAALLAYLYQRNQLVSKEELLQEVWSYHPQTQTHTVETHVYALRQKIGPEANALIQSSTEGYRLLTD